MAPLKPNRRRTARLKNPLGIKKVEKIQPAGRRPLPRSGTALSRRLPLTERLAFWRRPFRPNWKKVAIVTGATVGALLLMVAGVFAYYVRDLPNPKKLENRTVVQSTQIVDRNDKPIYTIHGDQNRTVVESAQISDYAKQASVAVENDTFYTDHGVSFKGIARAVLVRLHLLKDRVAGGGSTITQQYVRNALAEIGTAETSSRKIKEIILSLEVDQIYSKDEILTGYLNEIPYGSGYYGIEAASEGYFGKHAKDLTLSEAATLAAIPNAPSYYTPYGNHLDDLFARKNYILDRMAKVGYITQAQAEQAKKDGPTLDNQTFKSQGDLVAPHFYFYVRERLISTLDPDPQIAEKMLDENGYYVKTSLDLDTQALAQQTLADMGPGVVSKYKATNAALVATDPKTGEILAMVGSIDYDNSKSGNTNFATAKLQPGSSFKPIVYATSWGPKYTYSPSTVLYDVQTDFNGYKPNNYNGKFNGAITERMALDGSLNIPAVKTLALVGVPNAIQTAQGMGISTLDPNGDYGLSLVLGSGEVEPVEMANAYGVFANGGTYHELRPILSISQNGKLVKDFTGGTGTKALEPEVAYEMSNVLSDNSSRAWVFGTKNNLTLSDRPVAAKSGTTENNRDAWTIGYTPSLSVAVWVGNNDPGKTMVKGADGSYVAAPIWNKFMSEYLKGKPVEQFKRPDSVKDVTVDKLSGKLPTDQSPADERITDIFAPWQSPKDSDNIHVKVRVVKATGKLATDLTPETQVEERTYFTIHSERPSDPNWEQPVQDWAKAKYGDLVGSPPAETDDTYTEANVPTVSFTSPKNGSSVAGTTTFTVAPGGTRAISRVDFSINNVQVGSATAAPWSVTYNTANLPPGSQTVAATATNDLGLSATASISVTTSQDGTAPGNVSNATATNGKVGVTPLRLAWINPSDSDVASVDIYQSSKAGVLGDKVKTLAASANSAGTAEFSPTAGTYYYTIRPVDASGNPNTSVNQVMAKML